MPFHHSKSSNSSQSQNAQQNLPLGAAAGILQAAQPLGSIGAPTGNLHQALSNRTSTTSDRFVYSLSGNNTSQSSAPPATRSEFSSAYGPASPNSTAVVPSSGTVNQPPQFDTSRHTRPDERRSLPSVGANNMASQRGALSPRDYTPAGPRIGIEQATPESSQYHSGGQVPGSLQAGRPGPVSSNSATSVPTGSQNMSQDQYTTPSRSSGMGSSHNYTRSSPAGFEGQSYVGGYGATTPGGNDFTSPTSSKYTPQNAQRNVSNTPLGLADIRPRADSGLESPSGANPYSYDGANAVPTNSNYLAPWAIYAFDWCKWPAQGRDGGKLAVGSYLEDGHNFVRNSLPTER
jgi:WD repeat-containing protein 68